MNLGHENEQQEFKKSTSELKEGVASIASILNKHGAGKLYFGVRKDGEVCGQDVSESTLREISQAIGNHIEPSIYPSITHEKTLDGKDYVKVVFEGDNAPYSCGGKYRIRVADEDVLMRPDELRLQFREAENRINPWDRRISDKSIADVDEQALRSFLDRGRDKGRIAFDFTTAEDALERLGLIRNGMLLNAGAALFCPSATTDLKMAVFTNHARTDIVGLQHESGVLFDLVRSAEMFVISNTRSRVDTSVPGASEVYPEIPRKALHEGLMNAYAHRDWTRGGAVMVEIFNDAVEIISPGWFVEGQDPDEHLSGESVSAESRNQLIAQTLFKSGDIESQGTGIKRIKDFCVEVGMKVEYVRTPDGTKLIFHRNDAFGRSLTVDTSTNEKENVGANVVPNVGVNVEENRLPALTTRQKQVIAIIARNPSATASSIAEECGITERSVQRNLRTLRESGIITRQGSDKTGVWIISDSSEQ